MSRDFSCHLAGWGVIVIGIVPELSSLVRSALILHPGTRK